MTTQPDPIVQMKNIGKVFGSVRVLENVDFNIYPGEVHVLAGENGAGKSTLIKILAGVHTSHEGEIFFEGKRIAPSSPVDANNEGISVIYQELSLVPSMTVVDNLFLGRTETQNGFVKKRSQIDKAKKLLKELDLNVNEMELVENLPMPMRQLIEIAKAVSLKAKVIVMDEPSSALNAHDAERLFTLIDTMKKSNYGIVYITHRMEEIERLADRITILRDGKWIASAPSENFTSHQLITLMVGREIKNQINRKASNRKTQEKFRIENANLLDFSGSGKKIVDGVSLNVREGEVLGIAGLRGSGASELLSGIFGAYNCSIVDRMVLNGKEIKIRNPKEAIAQKVAMLTNNRKTSGLVLSMSIKDNICLANLPILCRNGWRNMASERKAGKVQDDTFNFHVASLETEVEYLSGGNQQKVALAKWLQIEPEVLLLDEPTRGIDVGAKHEIYNLINELTKKGIAILLITSEMPELIDLSDRIIVMHRGKISAEFQKDEIDAEKILEAAMGKMETVR